MHSTGSVLGLIGIAARAGGIVPGTERVREAVRAGTAALVLLADDASANSRDKLVPLLESRGVRYIAAFDRSTLGAAVGRAPLSAVAMTDRRLAERVSLLLGDRVEGERTRTGPE